MIGKEVICTTKSIDNFTIGNKKGIPRSLEQTYLSDISDEVTQGI